MNSLGIETGIPNIHLRQLEPHDAKMYFEAVQDNRDHLMPFCRETVAEYPDLASVEHSIVHPKNPNKIRLGIWDDENFAGTINATPKPFGTEIGYWLSEEFTGRGLATVSVRALAQYLRGEGHRNIFARVELGNIASCRVLERSNFFHSSTTPGEDPKRVYTYLDPIY